MSFSDSKDCDPEQSDADGCYTDNTCAEEEHGDQQEDDIVDGEYLRSLDQDPVDRLEDVGISQQVATVSLADRVLCFVNSRDEHAREDQKDNNDQQSPKDEFDGSENSSKLDPHLVEEILTFSRCFVRQSLSPAQGSLFPN